MKTRKQIFFDKLKNESTIKCLNLIYQKEGLKGLFSGSLVRSTKHIFLNGSFLTLYENILSFLDGPRIIY